MNKTLLVLIVEWIIFSVAFLTAFYNLIGIKVVSFGLSALSIGILSTMFIALIVELIFQIIGPKGDKGGKYFSALTPIVYSIYPISLGSLLAALFTSIPIFGMLVSVVTVSIFAAIGLSVLFRGLKEMFSADTITTWIGISIVILTVMIAFYTSALFFGIQQGYFSLPLR